MCLSLKGLNVPAYCVSHIKAVLHLLANRGLMIRVIHDNNPVQILRGLLIGIIRHNNPVNLLSKVMIACDM